MRFTLNLIGIYCLLLVPFSQGSEKNENEPQFENQLQQCRQISALLERLSCYDEIKLSQKSPIVLTSLAGKGKAWTRANQQEQERDSTNLQFIRTESPLPNPQVVLTTPALGYPSSDRPILMFSCIDNITRLQVALPTSLGQQTSIGVKLITDKNQLQGQWFVRENGFIVEASRGLDGIKEIQQLFQANQMKIQFDENKIMPLTFNIEQLEETIKPLRTMCHW